MKPTSAQIVWRKYLAEKINEEEITYGGQEIIDYGNELAKSKREISSHKEITSETLTHFLEEIKSTLTTMKIEPFDGWVSENSLYDDGLVDNSINKLKKTKYSFEKEGAL